MEKTGYTYDEFLMFVLMHAAHADYEYTAEEKELIFSRTDAATYERIKKDYADRNDFQCLQTILSYRDKYFSTDEEKEVILKAIAEMFKVDGDYSQLEKVMHQFVSRIIN